MRLIVGVGWGALFLGAAVPVALASAPESPGPASSVAPQMLPLAAEPEVGQCPLPELAPEAAPEAVLAEPGPLEVDADAVEVSRPEAPPPAPAEGAADASALPAKLLVPAGAEPVPALPARLRATRAPAAPPTRSLAPAPAPVSVEPPAPAAFDTASATLVRSTFFPAPVEAPPPVLFDLKEVEAPFATEPFRSARTFLQNGRALDALARLPESIAVGPEERYLRAVALLKAERWSEAARAFLRLAPAHPTLSDRCYFHAGVAFAQAQENANARVAYAAVDEGSQLRREARRRLARLQTQAGDLAGASQTWAELARARPVAWQPEAAAEALFALAEIEERQGRKEQAVQRYLELWSTRALAPEAGAAFERARRLGGAPDLDQRIGRAELLMEANRTRASIDIVQPLLDAASLSPEQRCRARFVVGKSYRKLRQHEVALGHLTRVVDECPPGDVWARATYIAGTSASIVDPERGAQLYRRLFEELPDHPFADDALFFAGELQLQTGQPDAARHTLRTLVRLYPGGDYRAEGLFKLFWLERSEGNPEAALAALERLERDYAHEADQGAVERARYWHGRTLLDLERTQEGLAVLARLVAEHPAGYYALLARSRLEQADAGRAAELAVRLGTSPGDAGLQPLPVGALAANRHFLAGVALMRLGLLEEAADELLFIERAPLRRAQPPVEQRLLVVLLARMGETRLAQAIARSELKRDLSGMPEGATLPVWQAAYPLAYRSPIEQHSGKAGIDPDLLQALIREESSLDPRVQSWAGAVGLCQLMLPTAREVARQLNVRGPMTASRLYDPDLNIRLGAHYLAWLVRGFQKNVPLALAAYNAGGGSVRRWIGKVGQGRQLDEFVEQIPVHETRNYVKRVLRSYATYQLLYGRSVLPAISPEALLAATEKSP